MEDCLLHPPCRKTTLLVNALVPNIIDESYSRFDILLHEGKISRMDPPRSLHEGHDDDLAIDEIIDCSEKMLLSGFVNAHAHSNEHWSRGLIRPLPLEMWILQLIRHEPRGAGGWHGDKSFEGTPAWAVGMSALHTGVECLLSGVSAIVDHLFVRHLEDVAEAVRAYKALGIRAFIAPMLNDDKEMYGNYIPLVHDASKRNACLDCACSGREVFLPDGGMAQDGSFRTAPGDYDPVKTKAALQLWEDAIQQFHNPSEGIEIVVGPVTVYSCSPDLLRGAVRLRKKYNLCGHTHVLETRAQCLMAKQYFPSGSAVKHLRDMGFLDKGLRGTSLAHTVWLTEEEMEIVADCGGVCVHNPLSNLRLGSGIFPLSLASKKGVTVAMGIDGSCSSDGQDMLEALKIGTMLTAVTDADYREWCTAKHMALTLASRNGYAAVGLDGQAGEIKVGMDADVTLWDLTSLALLPRTDPVNLLILGSRTQAPGAGSTLHSSWVQGRRVVRDGSPTGVDVESLRANLMKAVPEYRSSLITDPSRDPMTAAAEREYRAAMCLDDQTGVATPNVSVIEASKVEKDGKGGVEGRTRKKSGFTGSTSALTDIADEDNIDDLVHEADALILNGDAPVEITAGTGMGDFPKHRVAYESTIPF